MQMALSLYQSSKGQFDELKIYVTNMKNSLIVLVNTFIEHQLIYIF